MICKHLLELTDNLQPKDEYQQAKLKAELATLGEQDLKDLQFIESCTLSDLQKESKVLLHSCDITDPEDREAFAFECGHHDDSRIFSLHGSSGNYRMQSYNLVGFIGRNDVCVTIRSRFTPEGGGDYFLHYLMEKSARCSVVDLKPPKGPEDILKLLPLLFPSYLKRAVNQGLFKQYQRFEYNDSRPRGTIDVARHIKLNLPFQGKIAYSTREFSFDNSVTELIRHTYEYINHRPEYRGLFQHDAAVKNAVQQIKLATPSYRSQDRRAVMQANFKPCSHPVLTAYRPLQQLCLMILRKQGMSFTASKDQIFGVLFDISYLWEEYLATLLTPKGFTHLNNNETAKNKTKLHLATLAEKQKLRFYPDFYLETVDSQRGNERASMVVDAKYKRYADHSIRRADIYQMMGYMHALKAPHGILLCPVEQGAKPESKRYDLKGYGGILGTEFLEIPQKDVSTYADFCQKMQDSEKALNSSSIFDSASATEIKANH